MHGIWKSAILICFVLMLPGCTRYVLNKDYAFDLQSAEDKEITVDAIAKDQDVKVAVQSSGAPVNVYLFLEKDTSTARMEINQRKPSDKVLDKKEKTEDATLTANVPANNAVVILVRTATPKTAKVTLKITN